MLHTPPPDFDAFTPIQTQKYAPDQIIFCVGPIQIPFQISVQSLSHHSIYFSQHQHHFTDCWNHDESPHTIIQLPSVQPHIFRKLASWLEYQLPFDLIPELEDDISDCSSLADEEMNDDCVSRPTNEDESNEVIAAAIMEGLELIALCYHLGIETALPDLTFALQEALSPISRSEDAKSSKGESVRTRLTAEHVEYAYASLPPGCHALGLIVEEAVHEVARCRRGHLALCLFTDQFERIPGFAADAATVASRMVEGSRCRGKL